MAKDKLTDYDSTASGNLDVGGISVAEGMLPSGVNNAIREQMSHLADFAAGTSGVDVLKLQDDTDTNSIKLQAPASVTATTTFTLPDGDGASGQAMITDGAGTLSWAAPYGNRNLIINGAMQVVQRGTSATGITGGGFHTVDRLNNLLSSAGTWTFSQDTDVPSGQGFSYSNKRQCTTANASLGSGSYFVDYYSIEGQDLQQLAFGTSSAKSLTLSFWVKTNKTGTYQITFTTASASKSIGSSYTVNAANTWEKKTLTIVGDTASGIVNDNTVGLTIEMWYAAGTDFTSGTMPTAWGARVTADRAAALTVNLADSTSNYLNITGLQLEVGEQATPFEHRSFGDELARCQRYYYQTWPVGVSTSTDLTADNYDLGVMMHINDSKIMLGNKSLPVTMRASPSVTILSPTSASGKFWDEESDTDLNFSTTGSQIRFSPDEIVLQEYDPGATIRRPAWIHIFCSAEL